MATRPAQPMVLWIGTASIPSPIEEVARAEAKGAELRKVFSGRIAVTRAITASPD